MAVYTKIYLIERLCRLAFISALFYSAIVKLGGIISALDSKLRTTAKKSANYISSCGSSHAEKAIALELIPKVNIKKRSDEALSELKNHKS